MFFWLQSHRRAHFRMHHGSFALLQHHPRIRWGLVLGRFHQSQLVTRGLRIHQSHIIAHASQQASDFHESPCNRWDISWNQIPICVLI